MATDSATSPAATTLEYWPDRKIAFLAHRGRVDAAMARRLATEFWNFAIAHGAKRLLKDDRGVELVLKTGEVFDLLGLFESLGLTRTWRVAIVYSGQAEQFQFLETVASNRGYALRVFTDIERATAWLSREPEPLAP